MALSRIWSAFIIIAILVATMKIYISAWTTENIQSVSNRKKYRHRFYPCCRFCKFTSKCDQQLQYEKTAVGNDERVIKEGSSYTSFPVVPSNGIIDTCKGRRYLHRSYWHHGFVHGFYDHCRKSRRYSIFIKDHRVHFSKMFPDIYQKVILQWGTLMMMNFFC